MLPQSTPKIMTWLEFTLSKDIIYIYSGKWNICNKNLQLCPLKRRRGPSFNQSWISLAKWYVVSNFNYNWPSGSRYEVENVTTFTDGQTDWRLQRSGYEILLDHELSAQVKKKATVCTCVRNSHQTNVQNLIFIVVSFDNSFGKKRI